MAAKGTGVLFFLLLFAQTVAAAPGSANSTPDRAVVDLNATTVGDVTAVVEQTWIGAGARAMRQSLDIYFGAADGNLTASELDRIARATEADVRNKTLGWIQVDGKSFVVQNIVVSFTNATGAVDDARALSMVHNLVLAGTPTTLDAARITISPLWNGTLTYRAPANLAVNSATGFTSAVQAGPTVTGGIARGGDLALAIGEPVEEVVAPPTSPTGAQATSQPLVPLPAMAAIAAGLLVGVLLLIVAVRRRHR